MNYSAFAGHRVVRHGPLTAVVCAAWVDAGNRRVRYFRPVEKPTIRSVIIETVNVIEEHRRQGHFARFVATVCAEPGYEMVVVSGVQNPILADALTRLCRRTPGEN